MKLLIKTHHQSQDVVCGKLEWILVRRTNLAGLLTRVVWKRKEGLLMLQAFFLISKSYVAVLENSFN